MRRILLSAFACALALGAAPAVAEGTAINFVNPPGNLDFMEPAFGHGVSRGTGSPAEVPVTQGGGSDGPNFSVGFHGLLEFGITKRWENPE